jgi:hypothetical protein
MCNLYSLTRAREAMLRLFRVTGDRGPLKTNGETVDQEVFAFMTTEKGAAGSAHRDVGSVG